MLNIVLLIIYVLGVGIIGTIYTIELLMKRAPDDKQEAVITTLFAAVFWPIIVGLLLWENRK